MLSSTLVKIFDDGDKPRKKTGLDEQQIENVLSGLKAINKRSKGLSRFVESYKSLTKIPEPNIKKVKVEDLFSNIVMLMKKSADTQSTEIDYEVRPTNLHLFVDERLIEQVLINLIKNALEAGEGIDDLRVVIRAEELSGKIKMEVTDNGAGISPDVLDNIFVPFYTTKKDGSGIGLSLSRQILRKHGGNLEVISEEGKGTTFIIAL